VLLVATLGLAALGVQRGEAAVPALYTAAQARSGQRVYEDKCASCHGKQEQGLVGPALKGPIFASPKANYTVRDIFLFLSVNMPAYAPGSLRPAQYVDVMSFLLQQNGFPAGTVRLTATMASTSAVPLLYHAGVPVRAEHARAGGGCGRPGTGSAAGVHSAPLHCTARARALRSGPLARSARDICRCPDGSGVSGAPAWFRYTRTVQRGADRARVADTGDSAARASSMLRKGGSDERGICCPAVSAACGRRIDRRGALQGRVAVA
jgi:mono/diheme cytochrome c family protein